MKVMLLVPNFWISGTVTFARELQFGWPGDWSPAPPIVVPTRSGRPSTRWGKNPQEIKRADATAWSPDVWGTPDEIVRLARLYDLVHVNEVETTPAAQEWWYRTLEALETPWTVQLHGNRYSDVDWGRVARSPYFTGVVWQTPGNVPVDLAVNSRVRLVSLPRPWNLRSQVDAPAPAPWINSPGRLRVGFHGRLAPDKGVAHVAALARHCHADVCIHGASPGGGMPYAFGLQETYLGQRRPAEKPWHTTYGSGSVTYCGPFADGFEVASHHDVHVSATRRGFSGGTEIALLEAIDAGCRIVVPNHMVEPTTQHELHQWTYEWEPRGLKTALRDELTSLTAATRAALAAVNYDPAPNRRTVQARHNPARLAREFFSVVAERI